MIQIGFVRRRTTQSIGHSGMGIPKLRVSITCRYVSIFMTSILSVIAVGYKMTAIVVNF